MKRLIVRVREFCGPFAKPMALVLLLLVIEQLVMLVIPAVQGAIIDRLIKNAPPRELYLLVGAVCAILIAENIIGTIRWKFDVYRLNLPLARHIAKLTMERLTGLSIGQHVSENSGVRQSVISQGQAAIQTLVDTALHDVLPLAAELGLVISFLLIFAPKLGGILLAGSAAFAIWAFLMNRRIHPQLMDQEDIRNQESKFRSEILRNMELVLQSAQEKRAVAENDESRVTVQEGHRSIWIPYVREAQLREYVIILTRAAIMIVGFRLVQNGSYTTGAMVTYWTWSVSALNRVSRVGPITRIIMENLAATAKFLQLLETPPEVTVIAKPVRPERYRGDIRFEDVTLNYRRRRTENSPKETGNQSDPSLVKVSLHIPAGRKVAFVGESGAGKSTVVYALLRSQNLQGGRILVDGYDLATQLDHRHLRQRIGLVSQHTFLFDKSLRYNIVYGLADRGIVVPEEKLERVVKMARIDRFMDRMERGYDTVIGERGVKLSGGERQRIGIARALIKDPDILIFDEATSSLDPMNEAAIQEDIDRVSVGLTTIIIAHRYSTIRNVDGIYVMERGAVAGYGTHDELMASCIPYRALLEHQQSGQR